MKTMILAVIALGLAACSSSSDPSVDDGTSNATIGGRLRSPLSVGLYDASDGMIHISNYLDRQRVSIVVDVGTGSDAGRIFCTGDLDVSGGKLHLTDRDCSLDLTKTKSGDVQVSGTVSNEGVKTNLASVTFTRRGANALQGVYTNPAGVELHVASSDDSGFTYELKVGDTAVPTATAKLAPSDIDTFDTYAVTSPGCTGAIVLERTGGAFAFAGAPKEPADPTDEEMAKCPLQTTRFTRTK